MKKSILTILAVAAVACMNLTAVGAAALPSSGAVIDSATVSTINANLSATDRAMIYNENLYNESMANVRLDGVPIVKVYREIYWRLSDKPLSEIIAHADSIARIDYMVLGENEVRLYAYQHSNGDIEVGVYGRYSPVKWTSDAVHILANKKILDEPCEILAVYCFDSFSSHKGASVYYVTSQGTYVLYYEYEQSSGAWFTEQDFGKYALDYYAYLIAPENNYDENGNPLCGGVSFLSYVDENYGEVYIVEDETVQTEEQSTDIEDSGTDVTESELEDTTAIDVDATEAIEPENTDATNATGTAVIDPDGTNGADSADESTDEPTPGCKAVLPAGGALLVTSAALAVGLHKKKKD